jgi:hypothetical protein
MKLFTCSVLFGSVVLLLSGCFSIRKNERNIPVYKRKEVLPVYVEQKAETPAASIENAKLIENSTPQPDAKAAAAVQLSAETPATTPALPSERIHRMVHESKLEIIASGMSPEYVEAHFSVANMIDEDTEKKVIWWYTIGEFKIEVIDMVSWTQDASGNIAYNHAIRQDWGTTRNIEKVISKMDAENAMRACIGDFQELSFRFTAFDLPGSASPWMLAKSTQPAPGGTEQDKMFLQGFINLETGACHKEIAGVIHAPLEEK